MPVNNKYVSSGCILNTSLLAFEYIMEWESLGEIKYVFEHKGPVYLWLAPLGALAMKSASTDFLVIIPKAQFF